MRGVPTLMVESPVCGLLQLNMFPAGETGTDKRVALPVASDAQCVLHLMPLESGYLPLTCRLRIKDGVPCPPGDAAGRAVIRAWPGGIAEVVLLPERLPRPARLPLSPSIASRTVFVAGGRRLAAEWASFGDWWLVIEEEDGTPLLTQAVPEAAAPGAVTVQAIGGRQHVVAQAQAGGDQRYVAVAGAPEGRWQVLYSDVGTSVEVSGDAVTVTAELLDTTGHRRQRRWQPGAPVEDRFVTADPPSQLAPGDIARAFLEALALGLDDEAASLLTPALRDGLSITEVRNFIGDIHEILPCRYGPASEDPGWAVARPAGSGLYEVIPYTFSLSGGLIDNIVPGS
ncbi:MAG: hypothetical protein ACOX7W_05645 [Christensenellales bacterium]|jgi:hypothetical protein